VCSVCGAFDAVFAKLLWPLVIVMSVSVCVYLHKTRQKLMYRSPVGLCLVFTASEWWLLVDFGDIWILAYRSRGGAFQRAAISVIWLRSSLGLIELKFVVKVRVRVKVSRMSCMVLVPVLELVRNL